MSLSWKTIRLYMRVISKVFCCTKMTALLKYLKLCFCHTLKTSYFWLRDYIEFVRVCSLIFAWLLYQSTWVKLFVCVLVNNLDTLPFLVHGFGILSQFPHSFRPCVYIWLHEYILLKLCYIYAISSWLLLINNTFAGQLVYTSFIAGHCKAVIE